MVLINKESIVNLIQDRYQVVDEFVVKQIFICLLRIRKLTSDLTAFELENFLDLIKEERSEIQPSLILHFFPQKNEDRKKELQSQIELFFLYSLILFSEKKRVRFNQENWERILFHSEFRFCLNPSNYRNEKILARKGYFKMFSDERANLLFSFDQKYSLNQLERIGKILFPNSTVSLQEDRVALVCNQKEPNLLKEVKSDSPILDAIVHLSQGCPSSSTMFWLRE